MLFLPLLLLPALQPPGRHGDGAAVVDPAGVVAEADVGHSVPAHIAQDTLQALHVITKH